MKEELKKIIEYYGTVLQAGLAMEEAISKIAEEVPDMQIALKQMKVLFDIENKTAQAMEERINWILEKMEEIRQSESEGVE